MNHRGLLLAAIPVALLAGGCDRTADRDAAYAGEYVAAMSQGSAGRGARLILQHGCGACHTVPGLSRARGRVGPPLDFFAERAYIGGQLPNTPQTLVRWIMDPPALIPATAMPRLDVSERDARDIAAYLYTLH